MFSREYIPIFPPFWNQNKNNKVSEKVFSSYIVCIPSWEHNCWRTAARVYAHVDNEEQVYLLTNYPSFENSCTACNTCAGNDPS